MAAERAAPYDWLTGADVGQLATVRFSTTWLRPGYAMQDVNALLRDVSQASPA